MKRRIKRLLLLALTSAFATPVSAQSLDVIARAAKPAESSGTAASASSEPAATVGGAPTSGPDLTGMPELAGPTQLAATRELDGRWSLVGRDIWPFDLAATLGLDGSFRDTPFAGDKFQVVRSTMDTMQPAEVGGDGPRAREDWFYYQRAFPLATIPEGARQRALGQAEKIAEIVRPDKAGAASVWTSVGPGGYDSSLPPSQSWGRMSGRVRALAIDRTNPARLLLGTASGGAWLSTNSGGSWTPLTDSQPSLAIGAVAIDPTNPNVFYAGTGEGNGTYYGAGLLKSTNGGGTWSVLGASLFSRHSISGIAVSPQNGNTIVVCSTFGNFLNGGFVVPTTAGVFRSTNGGQTFSLTASPRFCDGLTVVPDNFNVMYHSALTGSGGGLYRSTDAGLTWSIVSGVVNGASVGRLSVGVSRDGSKVYVGGAHSVAGGLDNNGVVLQQSFDGGNTWTAPVISPVPIDRSTPASPSVYCETQCLYDNVVSVNPFDPNDAWLGGVPLFRTRDAGATWTLIGNNNNGFGPLHVDHHVLMFDPVTPGVVYSGNDGGIYRSTNGGTTWTSIGGTLTTLQNYHASLHPSIASIMFTGNQDNGTTRRTGSSVWTQVNGGDGGFSAINFRDPQIVYASSQKLRVSVSVDGGSTFPFNVSPPIPEGQKVGFIAPLIMDPVDPDILYSGSDRIWVTENGGRNWRSLTESLVLNAEGTVSAIAISPSHLVAYSVTSDGAVARVNLTNGAIAQIRQPQLPLRYATSVIVHPTDPNIAYVGFSGFDSATPTTLGHVFKTTDGGLNWTNVTGNLPDVPVNALALRPNQPNEIYAGTDVGVFISLDGGGSWAKMNNGLPNVAVASLAVNTTTDLLAAGTYGRSVWTTTLGAITGGQTLTVSKSGSGGGRVTSIPAGINCGTSCSASFGTGLPVVLSAAPDTGSTFAGWSGCDTVTAAGCNVTLNAARNVTATFTATVVSQVLNVSRVGSGSGTLTSSPAAINCGSTCSASFNSGTSVTLTATPSTGSVFAGWIGDCSGTGTCIVTMTQARNVTATFNVVATPVTEAFNTITNGCVAGWTCVNNSAPVGPLGWGQGNAAAFSAHAGAASAYIASTYQATTGTGTISNWLISPQINFSSGAQIRFWTRVPNPARFADRLEVRISTAGSSTNVGSLATSFGDFTTVVSTINPALEVGVGRCPPATGPYPNEWCEIVIGNAQGLPASGSGRIALRYFVTNGGAGTNSDYIGIDTFSFTPGASTPGVDEPSFTAFPLPAPGAAFQNCPGGYFVATIDDGPGTGLTSGIFGLDLTLNPPGTLLLEGGLNFGGSLDGSQVAFAGFNVQNATNEPQRLSMTVTGNPRTSQSATLFSRITLIRQPSAGVNETVYQTDAPLTLAQSFTHTLTIQPGFHVVTVAPIGASSAPGGAADGQVYVSLASQFVNRPGGGFFGGVVVGGYHAAPPFGDNSGFASFCLGTPHQATARASSAPTYGATGARDLRLRLLDHQRRTVISVPSLSTSPSFETEGD